MYGLSIYKLSVAKYRTGTWRTNSWPATAHGCNMIGSARYPRELSDG